MYMKPIGLANPDGSPVMTQMSAQEIADMKDRQIGRPTLSDAYKRVRPMSGPGTGLFFGYSPEDKAQAEAIFKSDLANYTEQGKAFGLPQGLPGSPTPIPGAAQTQAQTAGAHTTEALAKMTEAQARRDAVDWETKGIGRWDKISAEYDRANPGKSEDEKFSYMTQYQKTINRLTGRNIVPNPPRPMGTASGGAVPGAIPVTDIGGASTGAGGGLPPPQTGTDPLDRFETRFPDIKAEINRVVGNINSPTQPPPELIAALTRAHPELKNDLATLNQILERVYSKGALVDYLRGSEGGFHNVMSNINAGLFGMSNQDFANSFRGIMGEAPSETAEARQALRNFLISEGQPVPQKAGQGFGGFKNPISTPRAARAIANVATGRGGWYD